MKLKSFIVALFLSFCFFVMSHEVLVFGDDCPEVVDQQQNLYGTSAGSGEFGNVRYRGQVFTNLLEVLTAVEFSLQKVGFTDLRVFIDTVKEDSTPEHDESGAIFSFTIPNSELKEGMTKYSLPKELNVVHGKKYVIYFAPYKNGEYCDDYRDMVWSLGNPYDGGKGVVNINGEWSISDWGNIDLQFKTYGRECSVPPPPPTPTPICTPTPEPEPQPTCTQPEPTPTPVPVPEKLRVDYTNPFGGQTNVNGSELIRIEVGFNLLMDGGGFINTSAISMRNLNNWELITFYKVDVVGQKIYFYFNSGAVENGGITYEATIFKDRVRAANNDGSTLEEDHTWKFRTSENPKPTPTPMQELKVEKTTPANGETGVSILIDKLSTDFNFPIDIYSIGPFSGELVEVSGDKVVTKITIDYLSIKDEHVEWFITSGSLLNDKIYRMTVFNSVVGQGGEKMKQNYSWTFSTETTVPTPTPPPPTPTPTPTPKECTEVSFFDVSIKDMGIRVGENRDVIVSVKCKEGFPFKGVPILGKIKNGGRIISLNGKRKSEWSQHVVVTDSNGQAKFTVRGLNVGKGRVRFRLPDEYGYFKVVVKVDVD